MNVLFATSNKGKLEEVQQILGDRVQVSSVDIDLPELQGASAEEIAIEKAKMAFRLVRHPVLIEDTSLCFDAMGGLPGPYIKWFLEKLGHDGLNRMLRGFDDDAAHACCMFAYCESPEKVLMFSGTCRGRIVAARGNNGFGWDPIFEVRGEAQHNGKTFAELTKQEKNEISHRSKALNALHEHFSRT
jgi:inosine triphosphate pyrophosphatase